MMTYSVCYISAMIVMSLLRHSEAYYKYTSVIITGLGDNEVKNTELVSFQLLADVVK
jgi:hypothetical protein